MTQFSQTNIKKLNLHLEKLKTSTTLFQNDEKILKEKSFHHSKILTRNRSLAHQLLIASLFLKLEILNPNTQRSSLLKQILIKNKKFFIKNKLFNKSYLIEKNENILYQNLQLWIQKIYFLKNKLYFINQTKYKDLNLKIVKQYDRYYQKIEKLLLLSCNKFNDYYIFLKNDVIGKWYIYFSRWFIISFIHFVPFIQLCTSLFYSQPNKHIVNPLTSYLFNFAPFLLTIMNCTVILTDDNVSFLLLAPYLYFFIYSFKRYKISRKIAYQGSFAFALMIFRYSLLIIQEALIYLCRFTKRFFFLRKSKNINLLRDDFDFYIEDLEEMRYYKEQFVQIGESIFTLEDLTKVARFWEFMTILPLLGVIALLYNYMYFILRGQKPIIPVVTKTVRRMMIDRNGDES